MTLGFLKFQMGFLDNIRYEYEPTYYEYEPTY